MTHIPPGSDPSFLLFLRYSTVAFSALLPPIIYIIATGGESRFARRLFAAVTIAAVLGLAAPAAYAVAIPYDVCVNQCPYTDYVMWYLLCCFFC